MADAAQVLEQVRSAERFMVQQVFRPIANEYRISIPAPGSTEEGPPLLWVKQKRMKIKEDIRFRLDPEREEFLFMIKSKTVFEFRGRHEVLDAEGRVIGSIAKSFAKSLLRSHWVVSDASGNELFEAQEDNLLIALLRRFGDNIPFIGIVMPYLPFNFVLRNASGEVARYRRVLGKLRDRYVLEQGAGAAAIDDRLLIAFAVALDALQDR